MTAPRFGSGGSPLGAGLSGGLDAFWNVFQMLSEKKRQDALDAEARKQRDFQNARLTAGDTRAQHAQDVGDITTAAELGQQGAVVDDPTSASQSPGLPFQVMGAGGPNSSERAMTALRAPRPMTAADLQTPGRIRIDPTQSMAALLEAKRSGALRAVSDAARSGDPNAVRDTSAAYLALPGASETTLRGVVPAPRDAPFLPGGFEPTVEGRAASTRYQLGLHPTPAPPRIDPLSKEGIAAQQAIIAARGAGKPQGKLLPAEQVKQLGMFTDLERAARSIPVAMQSTGGDIGVGPIIGRAPGFVRDFMSGGQKIDARALVSSIAGQYMNLVSGAAVSPSEAARLMPFVPDLKDDEPTIKRKAIFFANRLSQIRKAREDAFRKAGYNVNSGGGDDSDQPPENMPPDVFNQYGLKPPPQ